FHAVPSAYTAHAPSRTHTPSLHDALPIYMFVTDLYVSSATEEVKAPFFRRHVKLADLVVFSRQFASMVKAGVPIVQTLESLAERSEEHTSELQSPYDLVCRLLLEKKTNDVHGIDSAMLINPETRHFQFIGLLSPPTKLSKR